MSITHSYLHTQRLLNSLQRVDTRAGALLEQLATGLRVNRVSDDPGAFVHIEQLRADVRSLNRDLANINEGISLGTVAAQGLVQISTALEEMEDLAAEASVVSLGATERSVLNDQYLVLRGQVQSLATGTEYNGIHPLDGSLDPITPPEPAVVTAPVAQTTTLTLDETLTFDNYGIFSGMSAAARSIDLAGYVAEVPATPAVVTAPVAQTQPNNKNELLEFEDFGIFAGMSNSQRRITLFKNYTQAQSVNAINTDPWISPLVQASVNGSGQLVLTSVATGSAAEFRVFSNRGAASNQSGVGTTPLEDAGTDLVPATLGLTQAEVVQAINSDPDISPLVTASVDAGGLLVLTSVATGSSVTFRVSSDRAATNDQTGVGTAALEDWGEDGTVGQAGLEIQAYMHGTALDRITLEYDAVSLSALGLDTSVIDTATNAQTAVADLDDAQDTVVEVAGQVAASISRLSHAAVSVLSGQNHTSAAIWRTQDLDTAYQQALESRAQVVADAARSMLAQANITPQMALALLG